MLTPRTGGQTHLLLTIDLLLWESHRRLGEDFRSGRGSLAVTPKEARDRRRQTLKGRFFVLVSTAQSSQQRDRGSYGQGRSKREKRVKGGEKASGSGGRRAGARVLRSVF
ncbi:hypothetical protein YC2023_011990 [Brassica napus]